jgi:hypothetical protein
MLRGARKKGLISIVSDGARGDRSGVKTSLERGLGHRLHNSEFGVVSVFFQALALPRQAYTPKNFHQSDAFPQLLHRERVSLRIFPEGRWFSARRSLQNLLPKT